MFSWFSEAKGSVAYAENDYIKFVRNKMLGRKGKWAMPRTQPPSCSPSHSLGPCTPEGPFALSPAPLYLPPAPHTPYLCRLDLTCGRQMQSLGARRWQGKTP